MRREIVFVIDGSGSMANQATDVRGGFNTYIQELLKDEQADAYSISATVFNTGVFQLFYQLPLKEVPKLTESNYSPGGGTALYDAIASTLGNLKDGAHFCFSCGKGRAKGHKFCADCGEKLNGDSAFTVIIMTDGEENSSRNFSKYQIVNQIQGKEKLGNWTFVYMGANQDAMKEGGALGIPSGNTWGYNTSDTFHVYRNFAASTTANYAAMENAGINSTQTFSGTASMAGIDVTGKTPFSPNTASVSSVNTNMEQKTKKVKK